jgi:hypothetical protein
MHVGKRVSRMQTASGKPYGQAQSDHAGVGAQRVEFRDGQCQVHAHRSRGSRFLPSRESAIAVAPAGKSEGLMIRPRGCRRNPFGSFVVPRLTVSVA